MKSAILVFIGTLFGLAGFAAAEPIPPGTPVEVRSDVTIDVRDADGRVFPGFVALDVAAPDGRILIPRGSPAELIVRRLGPRDFTVDLASITVDGQRYSVDSSDAGHLHHAGDAARTGAFAGGGVLGRRS